MEKAIVNVLGRDKIGVIAAVSNELACRQVNILDITQTILQEYFTMVMLVDMSQSTISFDELKSNLNALGKSLDMKITIQHEDIFNTMHRI